MRRTCTISLFLLAVFLLPFAGAALAEWDWRAPTTPSTIYYYPGPGSCSKTLQDCISNVGAGDTIKVAANTYITNLLIITRALVLEGAGPALTILRPVGAHGVLTIGNGIAAGVTISGMRIMSGTNTANGAGIYAGAGTPLTVINTDILSNTSIDRGGGINAEGAITLTNVNVVNNRAAALSGGGLRAAGAAIINGGRFERNVSAAPGGALRVYGFLSMTHVTVISNAITDAWNGGGIRADAGMYLLGGLVQSNLAGADGGGIYATGGTAVISAARVISNAGNSGGGVYATGALTVINSVLDRNLARAGSGGALYASDPASPLAIVGSTSVASMTVFSNNRALNLGGALYAADGVQLAGNLLFDNNDALTGEGGAIYAASVEDVASGTVTQQFYSNSAMGHGGAIRATGSVRLCPARPTFVLNSAGAGISADGGAIFADGDVTLCSGAVGTPSAHNGARHGGAVYAKGGVVLDLHEFGANTALLDGGCVYSEQSVRLSRTDAIGCVAGRNGGAAYALGTVLVNGNGQSELRGNRAGVAGGAAYAPTVTVYSAHLITNVAGLQGGAVSAQTAFVHGATFISNAVGLRGGAIAVSSSANITDTLFQTNRVTSTESAGGAVWVTGTLQISGSSFLTNTAGDGAGAALAARTITSTRNVLRSNHGFFAGAVSVTQRFTDDGSQFIRNSANYSGGGVLATDVRLTGTQFISNSAGYEGVAIWTAASAVLTNTLLAGNVVGDSGGVYARGALDVTNGQFRDNDANSGSAILSLGPAVVRGSTFERNSSAAGALLAFGALEVFGSRFENNWLGCCDGGAAIQAKNTALITTSTFISNVALCCDGGAVRLQGYFNIGGSVFISNQVSGGTGGAVAANAATGGNIIGSQFVQNTAGQGGTCANRQGGAIKVSTFLSPVVVKDSLFDRNSADFGGAFACAQGGCGVYASTFVDNRARCFHNVQVTSDLGGGGAIWSAAGMTVQRSAFLRNSAGAHGGGAIAIAISNTVAPRPLLVSNSLFAENRSANTLVGATGAAVVVTGSVTTQLYHNTIVSDTLNGVSAVAVYSGTATIVNNIIAGHATGIERLGGTVFEDYNLFHANTSDTGGGVTSGGSSFAANPLFTNPALDNYHIGPSSPALNAGFNVGIVEDFDGETRPVGTGYDIGFDEYSTIPSTLYLPLIRR